MFEIALLIATVTTLVILYRLLPNRKVFIYFCIALLLVFSGGAFVGHHFNHDPSIDETQRYALQQQEQIFIAWYGQYQKDIEQLDRNWQLYHNIIENFHGNAFDIDEAFERLRELEEQALIEQVQIHMLKAPPGLGDECSLLIEQMIRKTQLYADAQVQTIALTKTAASPEVRQTEDRATLSKIFQDVMIRESPTGLFTANEIAAIRNYFAASD